MILHLKAKLRRAIHALRRLDGGGYRPERHYMRGPGPKWRARNGCACEQERDRKQRAAPIECGGKAERP